MRKVLCRFVGALLPLLALPVFASPAGDGLKLVPDTEDWPRWQARLSVVSAPLASSMLSTSQLQLGAARLAGDHYFDIGRVGDGGGLRATSALLLGTRSLAMAAPSAFGASALQWQPSATIGLADSELSAATYLGVGYSAWWSRAGLGISADLGLMALRGRSTLRLGDGVDAAARGVQLSPVLQVNLSYSF